MDGEYTNGYHPNWDCDTENSEDVNWNCPNNIFENQKSDMNDPNIIPVIKNWNAEFSQKCLPSQNSSDYNFNLPQSTQSISFFESRNFDHSYGNLKKEPVEIKKEPQNLNEQPINQEEIFFGSDDVPFFQEEVDSTMTINFITIGNKCFPCIEVEKEICIRLVDVQTLLPFPCPIVFRHLCHDFGGVLKMCTIKQLDLLRENGSLKSKGSAVYSVEVIQNVFDYLNFISLESCGKPFIKDFYSLISLGIMHDHDYSVSDRVSVSSGPISVMKVNVLGFLCPILIRQFEAFIRLVDIHRIILSDITKQSIKNFCYGMNINITRCSRIERDLLVVVGGATDSVNLQLLKLGEACRLIQLYIDVHSDQSDASENNLSLEDSEEMSKLNKKKNITSLLRNKKRKSFKKNECFDCNKDKGKKKSKNIKQQLDIDLKENEKQDSEMETAIYSENYQKFDDTSSSTISAISEDSSKINKNNENSFDSNVPDNQQETLSRRTKSIWRLGGECACSLCKWERITELKNLSLKDKKLSQVKEGKFNKKDIKIDSKKKYKKDEFDKQKSKMKRGKQTIKNEEFSSVYEKSKDIFHSNHKNGIKNWNVNNWDVFPELEAEELRLHNGFANEMSNNSNLYDNQQGYLNNKKESGKSDKIRINLPEGISLKSCSIKLKRSSPITVGQRILANCNYCVRHKGQLFPHLYSNKDSPCIICKTCYRYLSVPNFLSHQHPNCPRHHQKNILELIDCDDDPDILKTWKWFCMKKGTYESLYPSPIPAFSGNVTSDDDYSSEESNDGLMEISAEIELIHPLEFLILPMDDNDSSKRTVTLSPLKEIENSFTITNSDLNENMLNILQTYNQENALQVGSYSLKFEELNSELIPETSIPTENFTSVFTTIESESNTH